MTREDALLCLDEKKINAPKIAYSKCILCITKDGIAAEKDVICFEDYGVCLCKRHFDEMMKDYLGVSPIF